LPKLKTEFGRSPLLSRAVRLSVYWCKHFERYWTLQTSY